MSSEKLIDEPGDIIRIIVIALIVGFIVWILTSPENLPAESWADLMSALGELASGL